MRTILDCERDLKGPHTWRTIGTDTGPGYILWCWACGAVGNGRPSHLQGVVVTNRVQEKEGA